MVLRAFVLGWTAALALSVPGPPVVLPVPADTTLERLRGLRLDRVRVLDDARPLVLRRPVFRADGIGYEKAEGFPRPRPALIAGSGWDSVPDPANPIGWDRIRRVERPAPGGYGAAAALGGAGGFALGFGLVQAVSRTTDWTSGQTTGASLAAGALGAVIGSWLIHGFFGPEPGWDIVYAAP